MHKFMSCLEPKGRFEERKSKDYEPKRNITPQCGYVWLNSPEKRAQFNGKTNMEGSKWR